MSSASTASVAVQRGHRIRWAVAAEVLGLVLMALAAFFHLIDEEGVPYSWLVAPIIFGILGAALVGTDRRLGLDQRRVWAAGLVCTGLAAVAVALLMIYYILPL